MNLNLARYLGNSNAHHLKNWCHFQLSIAITEHHKLSNLKEKKKKTCLSVSRDRKVQEHGTYVCYGHPCYMLGGKGKDRELQSRRDTGLRLGGLDLPSCQKPAPMILSLFGQWYEFIHESRTLISEPHLSGPLNSVSRQLNFSMGWGCSSLGTVPIHTQSFGFDL